MDDISRELEKEIAKAKPAPYKVRREKKVLIVDDFGELRSGGYLKTLAWFFFVISLAGVFSSAVLYYMFAQVRAEKSSIKERLAIAENKANRLTRDKEILMARLVMAGKEVGLESPPDPKTAQSESKADNPAPPQTFSPKEPQDGIITRHKVEKEMPSPETADPTPEDEPAVKEDVAQADVSSAPVTPPVTNDSVSVEKFSVVQGKTKEQLVVRFNIRNVSKENKIAGRIFAVMRPDNDSKADWQIVPGGKMENGMPGPYRKGKYFSITRYKPLSFTIKSKVAPERFKKATVYVFGEDETLVFKNTMAINGAK